MRLGVNLWLTFLEIHHRLTGKHIGRELADEEQDDSEVGEIDASLAPGEAKAFHVRGDQIEEQGDADQIAAGEDRRHPPGISLLADDQEAPEPAVLRIPQPFVDLRPAPATAPTGGRRTSGEEEE